MNRVLKFEDYKKSVNLIEYFVDRLVDEKIQESKDDSVISRIVNQLQKDLNFNLSLITTFGTGIAAMYPIVLQILKNSNLNIELSTENVVLLTITAISMAYLEEKKNPKGDTLIDCDKCSSTGTINDVNGEQECNNCKGTGKQTSIVTSADTDTLKAELKLRGLSNGTAWASDGQPTILKKLLKCIMSVGGFLKMIFKHGGLIIGNLVDLFAYTSLLIPTMNAILGVVHAQNLNLETLPMEIAKNLLVFGVGLGTMLAKRGFEWLSKKITDFLKSKKLLGYGKETKLIDIGTQMKGDEQIINEQ